jgi:CheY-like chemotaxis protein
MAGRVARILVVDDEPDARFLLHYAFERAGHEVSEATDGAAALEAITASRPALVVTDMMMPTMGGAELIRRLRADPDTAGIPILCVSGNRELAVGADLALDKFGDLSDLIPLAEDLIAKGRDSE